MKGGKSSIYTSLDLTEDGFDDLDKIDDDFEIDLEVAMQKRMEQMQRRRRLTLLLCLIGLSGLVALVWYGTTRTNKSASKSTSSSSPSSPNKPASAPAPSSSKGPLVSLQKMTKQTDLSSSLDTPLGTLTSVSISQDGNTILFADSSTIHLVVFDDTNQRKSNAFKAPNTHAVLAGNGQSLAFASTATNGTVIQRRQTTSSWQQYGSLSDLHVYEKTVTDLGMDLSGSVLAVGYGCNETSRAEYAIDGLEWSWDDYRLTGTYIFQSDGSKSEFPAEYQGDDYGTRVAVSSDGSRIMQSTEHNIVRHYANSIDYSVPDHAWYGNMDMLSLNNITECDGVESDVGVSGDGSIVVVCVRCWKSGHATAYTHTFVESAPYSWTSLVAPLFRHWGNATAPFSISLSADAKTLVLATRGSLEILKRDDNQGWQTFDSWQGSTVDLFLTDVSSDGSKILVGANDANGKGTVSLFES